MSTEAAEAMKRVAADEMDSDRLSDLPEHVLFHILSFLPTNLLAAQTSLLSRRFRRLWEASPVLEFDLYDFRDIGCSHLVDLASRTILHRDPPSPLHSLCLNLLNYHWYDQTLLTSSFISSLLLKATSLGLRHLAVGLGLNFRWVHWDMHVSLLPLVFSIPYLESLSISLDIFGHIVYDIRVPIKLTHLKSLSIITGSLQDDELNYIISHLHALEDLHLKLRNLAVGLKIAGVKNFHLELNSSDVDLKLVDAKLLKLSVDCHLLKLSCPNLELFEFVGMGYDIQWEMPMLKKASVQLKRSFPEYAPATCEILKAIAHVEELHLDIEEAEGQDPFHMILVPGVDLPTLVSLKHFNLELCFHEYNIEDLVALLEHSPSLESLNLVHKPFVYYTKNKGGYKENIIWRSKLPRNADGKNCTHAYFKDLHIDEKRKELINQLIRKIPKKRKA